ncbi:BadF/BadG/BcrA/BcrD ATPase family protein [Streptomyces montanisoli]|uniref:ATPase n=1 Tax=Streptomyces montanisoli TaxID=2798581 RepID=A0A940MEL7_9ACTN|nr:BadF/BadG/BcrA/BcrD ATPase family protein [Streptomyces montanisoli]MBP0459463.1 ATPase [Streptomyces montanisoli]
MAAVSWVLGVDSGGSGLRIALGAADGHGAVRRAGPVTIAEPVPTGPAGIDAGRLLDAVVPAARALLADAAADGRTDHGLAAVAVGAAGMATLGGDLRARLPGGLRDALGVRVVALAADAVTGYAGALGARPGAVVAAGTGMIALGTDLVRWRRADGWGHLLGDCGGGAWIGRAGLDAAMRAYDGRRGGSAALLARAEEALGPAPELPGLLYPRTDRAAVLASFAPEVAACAGRDPVAAGILSAAAEHIADAAAAVAPASGECRIALTGGLFRMGEPLLGPVRAELAARVPGGHVVEPEGDPLAGALTVAAGLAAGELLLPLDARLLTVAGP